MRNILTLAISIGLLAATGGTAWVFVSLSKNIEFKRVDVGSAAEIKVP